MGDDGLLLAWGNLDFGRRTALHVADLRAIAERADVIGTCELRERIELPGFHRFSPDRLDGSPGSEAIYVRDTLAVSSSHAKLEFLDRAGQMIGFRRILDVTVHHPVLGDVTSVSTHIPPRRMQRALLAPSMARLRGRIRRLQRTGRTAWVASADWNLPLVSDPGGIGSGFSARWLGPGRGPHVSGIDGYAVSPGLQEVADVACTAVPHPERSDGHPTVLLQLTPKHAVA